MAEKKQDADKGLEGKLLSKDLAWQKAEEIMAKFSGDEAKRFRRVGGYLNIKEKCIDVRASFRTADRTPELEAMMTGTEYFVEIVPRTDVLGFPYAIFKVPYNPAESRPYKAPVNRGYNL